MTCAGYLPNFQRQLNPADPLGSVNCVAYSFAMAGEDDSCGAKHPTGERVRSWTGDKSGGLTLAQGDDALRRGFAIDLDTRYGIDFDTFHRRIVGGASAVVLGGYAPLLGTAFAGSTTFRGNHAILVAAATPSAARKLDPLCDGRRKGLANDAPHGTWIPIDLLRRFIGALEDDAGHRIGADGDRVWASFSRDNEPDFAASVQPLHGASHRRFAVYAVGADGRIKPNPAVRRTGGFSATCTAPRRYLWPGHGSKSLVLLTSGFLRGRYIVSAYAEEIG